MSSVALSPEIAHETVQWHILPLAGVREDEDPNAEVSAHLWMPKPERRGEADTD